MKYEDKYMTALAEEQARNPFKPADHAGSYASLLAGLFLVAAGSSVLGIDPAPSAEVIAKREAYALQLKQLKDKDGNEYIGAVFGSVKAADAPKK